MPPASAPAATAALPRQPWIWRLREWLGTYLPLLLMALLALATWWLVRATPVPEGPRAAQPLTHDPDYTMQRFALQRFGVDGRLRVQIEGDQMRHYPDTETVEVDGVRVRALDADGSLTLARARQAWAKADGSELQLRGGAEVTHQAVDGSAPVEIRGELLRALIDDKKVRSDQPVTMTQGANRIDAA